MWVQSLAEDQRSPSRAAEPKTLRTRCLFAAFHISTLAKAFASPRIPRLLDPNKSENFAGRVLLIGLVAGILAFVPVQRSDAGVSFGIGIGFPGYYGYYPYGYYYPYSYYRPYPYYGYYWGPSFYWYGGHRYYYRHHRHHHYYRR